MMPDFDNLKDKAKQYLRDHPEQVEKAEQAAERKLGIPDDQAQQDQTAPQQGRQDVYGNQQDTYGGRRDVYGDQPDQEAP
jgi:hypothetical protein